MIPLCEEPIRPEGPTRRLRRPKRTKTSPRIWFRMTIPTSLSSVTDAGAAASGQSSEGGPRGWVLLPALSVPERWRDRGVPLILVPLLSEEAEAVLAGHAA